MTRPKRHIRTAVVEQLSIRDTEIPEEARDSWSALKQYISGYDNPSAPTKRQLQDLYELVLGYQIFIVGAYRVTTVPVEEKEPEPEQSGYRLIIVP